MLGTNVWRMMLGVDRATVIEAVEAHEIEDALVAQVRVRRAGRRRCGRCGRRAPGYDQGEGRRRWRALDLGALRCYLEADSPRVNCPDHGPTVAQVPWARHGAGHTYAFDDTVAWLVTHTAKSTVVELMRVGWSTVGAIVERVVSDGRATARSFGQPQTHRHRRDLLQKGPPLPTRGGRPRHRTACPCGGGGQQEDLGRVLRPLGRRAVS